MNIKNSYSNNMKTVEGMSAPGSLVDMTLGGKEVAKVTVTGILTNTTAENGKKVNNTLVTISFNKETGKLLKQYREHTFKVESWSTIDLFNKGGDLIDLSTETAAVEEEWEEQVDEKCQCKSCTCNQEPEEKEKETKMEPKIVISTDNKKVVEAKIVKATKDSFEVISVGTSKCHPLDKFNLEEGTKQALKRAFRKIKDAKEEVKKPVSLFYRGTDYGMIGGDTKFVDSFTMKSLYTGDQVLVLREGKSVKGVIADGLIITNDEILRDGKAFITLLKKYKDVDHNSVFAGVMYK